jgi:hypothetical protein
MRGNGHDLCTPSFPYTRNRCVLVMGAVLAWQLILMSASLLHNPF